VTLMHDHPTARHPGWDEILQKVQERYWWPKIKEWIAEYIKGCATCQQNKILIHCKKTPIVASAACAISNTRKTMSKPYYATSKVKL
jgi:hypothetical protein